MNIRSLLLLASLLIAGPALASDYLDLVNQVDTQLAANADLTEELKEQIAELRDEGAALHEEGKDDEAIEVLNEALVLLQNQ